MNSDQHPLRTAVLLAGLLACVAAVYWPGLSGGFIFDDYSNLLDNPALRVTSLRLSDWLSAALSSPASTLQRPAAMLTFAVNYYFTGYDAWAMKATNVAIHACNAALVFILLRAIQRTIAPAPGTPARWLPFFVAAAWALHPINVTAVLYVVQRMESLANLFVVLGLIAYVRGRQALEEGRNGWGWIGAGLIGGTALGLLAKESAVLLVPYAFLLEAIVFGFRHPDPKTRARLRALFLLTLGLPLAVGLPWLATRYLDPAAYATRDFTLSERLLTEARVLVDYLRWTVFPSLRELALYHDSYPISRSLTGSPTPLPAMLLLAVLGAAAWMVRKSRPWASLGIGWFFAAHTLTATVIPLELVFEHRNYFASIGVVMVIADLLLSSRSRMPAIPAVLAASFLFFCGATTYLRAMEWGSVLQLARSEAAKHPDSPRATYEYARSLIILSRYDRESPLHGEIEDALEAASMIPASGTLPEQASLIYAARTGRVPDGDTWNRLRAKLRDRSRGPQEQLSLIALTNCAASGLCAFPEHEMLETFQAALSTDPFPGTLTVYANYAANVIGDRELALRLMRDAVSLEPANAQYRINLIRLATAMGFPEEARTHIRALRKLGRLGQYTVVANSLSKQLAQSESH